jgi:cyclopropane fatty-acyl-phospholipid synthase-like methyltransferase
MNMMDYWAIAERDLEIQNPITDRKMRQLDDYCAIRDGLKVLDVGCGKGWLLRQWAERHDIRGTGIDLNPNFIRFAEAATARKGLSTRLSFISGKALDFTPEPASYDIALCLGASFALGGFVEALEWMAKAVRPGGSMVIGELTLKHQPSFPLGVILPHDAADSIAIIERHGAEVSATISASDADFERYVSHHRQATLAWGRQHPDHPDHAEVLKQSRTDWTHYLKIVRPYFGWTIFVGRRDQAPA